MLFSPLREVLLDAAGEARMRDPLPTGESIPDPDAPSPLARVLPEGLLRMVAEEPLGVVRVEVLRALEVRRPDVRAVLRWCDARDAAAIVAVVVDGELDGLLLFSSGPHTTDLGLRHVRALRAISRMSAMRLSLEAALARASARAQRAEHRARDVEHVLDRTQDREQRLASGVAAAARPLAARVATIGYAPGSRALLAELDALAKTPANLAIVHRPGSDPVPWIARLHVESKRTGAFVVVDASREASDPSHWSDPSRSPIELARNGTLLVLAASSLPREAQKRLVSALAFHEGPGADPSPVDVRLVLSTAARDPETANLGALDPALLAHVRPSPVRIAPLALRIEDLHALALDRLVAIAGALGRPPLGLAPDALQLLIEHSWPGDDVELDSVLVLAATSAGDAPRIERRHLESLLRG
jgi:transcriptional regulator of acetoin/glycerol metabolism